MASQTKRRRCYTRTSRYIGVIWGLYRDHGTESGDYRDYSRFREVLGLYGEYIGIVEKKMETIEIIGGLGKSNFQLQGRLTFSMCVLFVFSEAVGRLREVRIKSKMKTVW